MTKSKSTKKAKLSYKQMVKKIVKDRKFAKKVHKLVCKARAGDKEATKELKALFKITKEDLKQICLPPGFLTMLECNKNDPQQPTKTSPTSFMLIDFAAVVH